MMESTWTSRQVITFLMAFATGLQLTYSFVQNSQPMHSIDRLLSACIEQAEPVHPDERHFNAFKESLEPGFFNNADATVFASTQAFPAAQALHQDVMKLSDDSFVSLVASLSNSQRLHIKRPGNLRFTKNKGL